MRKEGKNRNKILVNREGWKGWKGNGEETKTKLYHVKVQIPSVEYDHNVYLKYINKLNGKKRK